MVSLKESPPSDSDSDQKPALRDRLGAWWNGTPVPAGPALKSAKKAPVGDDEAAARKQAMRDEARAEAAAAKKIPETKWSEARRKIAQLVWGDGFNAPGGVPLATELFQPLGLDKSSSMIEIGAGMGGVTREIASATGAYVTAFEFDPELAEEGASQADVVGLEKKASVLVLDPDNYEFKKNFYGGALIHEALFRIEDKESMVKAVIDSIKVESQIVIWDLFFEEPEPDSPLQEWLTGEDGEAYPWSHDAARQFLADNLIDIRVDVDETDRYCAMSIDAWSEFVAEITRDPVGEDLVVPIISETERWSRRVAAMQAGQLKVHRYTGIKRIPIE